VSSILTRATEKGSRDVSVRPIRVTRSAGILVTIESRGLDGPTADLMQDADLIDAIVARRQDPMDAGAWADELDEGAISWANED
jgi:hypothetical protein